MRNCCLWRLPRRYAPRNDVSVSLRNDVSVGLRYNVPPVYLIGLEKGREEANMTNAIKLKQLGVSAEIISQATGLDLEIVEEL